MVGVSCDGGKRCHWSGKGGLTRGVMDCCRKVDVEMLIFQKTRHSTLCHGRWLGLGLGDHVWVSIHGSMVESFHLMVIRNNESGLSYIPCRHCVLPSSNLQVISQTPSVRRSV